MEKTINCAFENCGIAFTYEPNPNYPDKRKYCDEHSAVVKASFAKFKNASESKPTHQSIPKKDVVDAYAEAVVHQEAQENIGIGDVPVEKIGDINQAVIEEGMKKAYEKGKKEGNGFHLTPEQQEHNLRMVKKWALASAIEWLNKDSSTIRDAISVAKDFEKYILGDDE